MRNVMWVLAWVIVLAVLASWLSGQSVGQVSSVAWHLVNGLVVSGRI
jgi:hypothetical protein